MRRVVFCRSNPVNPDPRVEKEAKALNEAGYSVKVVAWDRTANLPKEETGEGYVIDRLSIPSDYARGLGNLPGLIRWLVGLMWWLVAHINEYDIIHACDFDTVLPALVCKGLFGKTVVYDIFDFYADHLRNTPGWLLAVIRRIDLWAIGWADAVIIVDEARRSQIKEAHPRNLTVVCNAPEDIHFSHKDMNHRDRFNIVYVGLLQVERGLYEVLRVIRKHPLWCVDLAGFGGDEETIRDVAHSLENVYFHGRIPYRQTLQLTARSDVSLATYDPSIENHQFASPNKLFEAMMLSKPIIVARGTNMDRIVEKWNCGLVVEYGKEEDLERSLLQLDQDQKLRNRLGKNGRRAYEEKYAWWKMKERLQKLYRTVHPVE